MEQLPLECFDELLSESKIDLEILFQGLISDARQLRLEFEEGCDIHPEMVRCERCVDGFLTKPCKRCKGTGVEETPEGSKKCSKCNGKGFYILRKTINYEGKICFACNGTGKVKKIQPYYTTP